MLSAIYQETVSDMLSQCITNQSFIFSDNRTKHHCEKENFNEDFSYSINELQTHYSKENFWCFLFYKRNFIKLKYHLWFSHRNYDINAVSRYVVYNFDLH